MKHSTVEEKTGWQHHVGPLDHQRVVGHEFHVAENHAGTEGDVHAQPDGSITKGTFKPLVCHDESFALQANDSAVDHVQDNQAVHGLIAVHERERYLVAAADHPVPHGLLFSHLLHLEAC